MGNSLARIARKSKLAGLARNQGRGYRSRIRMYLGLGLIIVGGFLVAASKLGFLR